MAAADRTVEGPAPAGRVDLAVSSVGGISRAHAQRLIGDGRALVDGERRRSSDRLAGGETVRVELTAPADESLVPESIPLDVAYEDGTMLIVDKPAGLVVHPSAGHGTGTLVNALLGRSIERGEPLGSIAGVGRPGIVHRLDKETSGLIVVAKTDDAQASLMRQFGERTIEKEYLALVRGEAPSPRGRVEAPIGRDPRDRQRMAVVAGGRASTTEYEVLGTANGYALLSLRPLTGRTHQIRAHLSYLGLPIAGDLRYGGGEGPGGLRRQFLHAARLRLERPSDGQRLHAWSGLPADLEACRSIAGVDVAGTRLPEGVGAEVEA
ncbi:MAG: RluA family pseudouridine synthase [Chloroflexi bacterium]|nr:RluA family pseudouridine synthase [Chloroflexota bacterium]